MQSVGGFGGVQGFTKPRARPRLTCPARCARTRRGAQRFPKGLVFSITRAREASSHVCVCVFVCVCVCVCVRDS